MDLVISLVLGDLWLLFWVTVEKGAVFVCVRACVCASMIRGDSKYLGTIRTNSIEYRIATLPSKTFKINETHP